MIRTLCAIALAAVTAASTASAGGHHPDSAPYVPYNPHAYSTYQPQWLYTPDVAIIDYETKAKPPVYAPYHTPYVPLGIYKPLAKIQFPTCPKGFYESYKSADTYACDAMPGAYYLQTAVHVAKSAVCGNLYWDLSGVQVTGTTHQPIVRWVCKHS